MTEKQIATLHDLQTVGIGNFTFGKRKPGLIRTGNLLYNEDNTISIDMLTLDNVKGRVAKSIFKSLMTIVLDIIVTQYKDSYDYKEITLLSH